MRFLKSPAPRKQPPIRPDGIICEAQFSPCRTWRYSLRRTWAFGPHVMVIGLNPSTADELTDDPTVRRCIRFARFWGYGGLFMMNLFGWRATDPRELRTAPDPIGVDNDRHLAEYARRASLVVYAWGNHGALGHRGDSVIKMIDAIEGIARPTCLGRTQSGHPKHPLYLKGDLVPIP